MFPELIRTFGGFLCAPRLNALEEIITERRVRLIVVDSIAALLRRCARLLS